MTAVALTEPRVRPFGLVRANLLTLRRRRGLALTVAAMTIGSQLVAYTVLVAVHAANAAKHGPAGGVENLGHAVWLLNLLATVAAILVGTSAAVDDVGNGMFREVVVTGRSRKQLYYARIPGGLAFLLPFVASAYAMSAVASTVFAGSNAAPSAALLLHTGVWLLGMTTFTFAVALGLATLIGSKTPVVGILMGWSVVVSPLLVQIRALGPGREAIPYVPQLHLLPTQLQSAAGHTDVAITSGTAIAVLVLWAAVWLRIGLWRSLRREA
jgi:hypothetical protein